jgi:DNA polymerase III subunit delta'
LTTPDYFTAILGQAPAIEILTQATAQQRIAPAYLFFGVAGIGKSLTARCWLEMLLCHRQPTDLIDRTRQKIRQGNHPDLLWIEPTYNHQGQLLSRAEAEAAGVKKKAPPQIRIEQIRQITKFLAQPPMASDRAIVVVEQAETMAEGAANALLKTLEEPGRATLILLAHDSTALLPTLISRCQRISFQRLPQSLVLEILIQAGHQEIVADPLVVGMAQGSPGQAIELWEQLQVIPPEIKTELLALPSSHLQALRLAKQIDRELDSAVQLTFLDYLQYCYWQKYRNPAMLSILTASREQLLAYVQPRLVWECGLMSLVNLAAQHRTSL